MGPADPILGLTVAYKSDPAPNKVSLGVGAYRDDNGKPVVLECVKQALQKPVVDMEYTGIDGVPEFVKGAQKLVFGADAAVLKNGLVATTQTLSGTGALRVAFAFLDAWLPKDAVRTVFVPKPTWANHKNIIKQSGLESADYRYYDSKTFGLDFSGLVADLQAAPAKSVVLLHACAHNPTGVDPSLDQWQQIADVVKARGHIVVFDSAYQGFASGNPETDAQSYKLFLNQGINFLLCQSFAKNMGLYGSRTGALHVACASTEEAQKVLSQLKIIIRPMYSNPPVEGARLAATVLATPELNKLWHEELMGMAGRIIKMRQALVDELKAAGSTRSWKHITDQIGMFCYTGLTSDQVEILKKDHHLYLTSDGRISISGLTSKNVAQVAQAIHAVTKQ